MYVDVFLHIANVLYLLSYLVKDILILRLITVIAICTLIPYFVLRPDPLIAAVCWNLLFACVNIYRIVLLVNDRKPVYFDEIDQKLYDSTFASLTRHQFHKLLKISKRKTAAACECLFDKGSVLDQLLVIDSGAVAIKVNEQEIDQRIAGDFIGERSLITEDPIKASIEVAEDVTYTGWSRNELKQLLDAEPGLHAAFQQVLSRFLIKKIDG